MLATPGWVSVWEAKRRSRRLLPTTNTELNAIAAPASIGLSNPAAARGRAGYPGRCDQPFDVAGCEVRGGGGR